MIIKSQQDMEGMAEISRISAFVRDELARAVKPGVSTLKLDKLAEELFLQEGAQSAPKTSYNFPGHTCISVNEVACHGIPASRLLQEGDFVNIDISAEKSGYFADTGMTVIAGKAGEKSLDMIRASREALNAGIQAAAPGHSTATVGKAIFKAARNRGYKVIRNLTGHGVGLSLHEEPQYIFNYNERQCSSLIQENMVLAIETFITDGDEWVEDNPPGVWPVMTKNHSQVVQFEHTVWVTRDGNKILTATDYFHDWPTLA